MPNILTYLRACIYLFWLFLFFNGDNWLNKVFFRLTRRFCVFIIRWLQKAKQWIHVHCNSVAFVRFSLAFWWRRWRFLFLLFASNNFQEFSQTFHSWRKSLSFSFYFTHTILRSYKILKTFVLIWWWISKNLLIFNYWMSLFNLHFLVLNLNVNRP